MKRRTAATVFFVAGVAFAGALPGIAQGVRGRAGERCDLDGASIEASSRVRVVEADERSHAFCSTDCAERWERESGGRVARTLVTDVTTGLEIDADAAWFVWDRAGGAAGRSPRVRAFADEREARRHAAAFGGTVLEGDGRPFRGQE